MQPYSVRMLHPVAMCLSLVHMKCLWGINDRVQCCPFSTSAAVWQRAPAALEAPAISLWPQQGHHWFLFHIINHFHNFKKSHPEPHGINNVTSGCYSVTGHHFAGFFYFLLYSSELPKPLKTRKCLPDVVISFGLTLAIVDYS